MDLVAQQWRKHDMLLGWGTGFVIERCGIASDVLLLMMLASAECEA